ncbi:response regulator protein [Azoarcus sp. KH32C]|nr:response regulator protein [Azoarcus sp. KH32C]
MDSIGVTAMNEVLTTTEAAKLCGVSFRTVIRWVERGELNAYRLPGRGDYRIPLDELRRFMKAHGMPEPSVETAERRVLIVDDEPGMGNAIARALNLAGYKTAIAAGGFQAGTMIHTFRPNVMTLDLRMPHMDGFAVLDHLKEAPPPVPLKVLVISAETQDRLDAALARGAHGVLPKPFRNEDLVSTVNRLYAAA